MKRTGILLVLLAALTINLPAQWVNQSTGFTAPQAVWHISMADTNNIWACLYNPFDPLTPSQQFVKTTNGGTTWQPLTITNATGYSFSMIFALDDQKAWAVMNHQDSTGGLLLKTSDGGLTWAVQDSAVFHNKPKLVYFWNDTTGVCIGDPYENHYEIYTTTNGGNDWIKVGNASLPVSQSGEFTWHESYCVVGDTIWYGGASNGKIYYSQDRGFHWNLMATPLNELTKVLFRDSKQGLIGIADFTHFSWNLFSTQDGGTTWIEVYPSGVVNYNDICYVPGTQSTLVSVGNGISWSDNGGTDWFDFPAPSGGTAPYYTTVTFLNPKSGWAGGAMLESGDGAMFRFTGNPLSTNDTKTRDHTLSAYPNPCHGSFTLYASYLTDRNAELRIFNAMGSLMLSMPLQTGFTDFKTQIDVSRFNPGAYIVDVQSDNSILRTKLLVR